MRENNTIDEEIQFKALTDGLGFHTEEIQSKEWRRVEKAPSHVQYLQRQPKSIPQAPRVQTPDRSIRPALPMQPMQSIQPLQPVKVEKAAEKKAEIIEASKLKIIKAFAIDFMNVLFFYLLTLVSLYLILKKILPDYSFSSHSIFSKETILCLSLIGVLYYFTYFILGAFNQKKTPGMSVEKIELKKSNGKNLELNDLILFFSIKLLGVLFFFIPSIFFAPETYFHYKFFRSAA